jgi:heme exporter protein A
MTEAVRELAVEDLEVRRGADTLIEGLSFALNPGQRALLVGPNGTGKTSFLRVLAGIAPCTAGEIRINGRASGSWGADERAQIAYRAHFNGLKDDLTGRENLQFYSALRGLPPLGDQVITDLRLQGVIDRPTRQLSAGQKRRVGLAVLQAAQAKIWVLDEPVTNLDSEGRSLVEAWIDAHTAAGGIAVVATHQPDRLASPGTIMIEL